MSKILDEKGRPVDEIMMSAEDWALKHETEKKYAKTMAICLILIGFIALCLAVETQAYVFQGTVRNAYSFNPMESVMVTVVNPENLTDIWNYTLTDGSGEFYFVLPEANYTIIAAKAGYNTYYIYNWTLNDSVSWNVYMTEDSVDIIKFVYTDMTFKDHSLCIYFQDNGRLKGCYHMNDTILLSKNNYTFYVKQDIMDATTDQSNLLSLVKQLFPTILIVMVIGGFIITVLVFVYYIARRALR